MMFWSKTFRIKNHFIIAICDKELLGKRLSMNDVRVKINEIFYGGKLVDETEALELMEKCTMGNIVGKKIIDLAIRHNFIAEENVIYIGETPHAQFLQ